MENGAGCPTCGTTSPAFRAMSDAVLAIASERSVESILETIVEAAQSLAGARYAAIGVPDGDGGFERFITSGMTDEGARTLFEEHDELIRTAAASHDGLEVDNDGDAFMLAFSSARRAVNCAVAIQRSLSARTTRLPGVRVRIGLNTGDVIAEEDRYFGRAVFVASRVAAQATGGEILVSYISSPRSNCRFPPALAARMVAA